MYRLDNERVVVMDEKISPEERLFKAIQETNKSAGQGLVHSDSKGLKRIFGNVFRKFIPAAQIKDAALTASSIIPPVKLHHTDLKKVNEGLSVVLAILIISSIYYGLRRPNLSAISGVVSAGSYQAKSANAIAPLKELAFYAEQVKKRDIFHPAANGIKGAANSNLATLTKDLGVVGIYQPLDKPPEAMVEDKTAKKTYFLKEGDEIKGMKVKAILKDRVILRYGEEEMELM